MVSSSPDGRGLCFLFPVSVYQSELVLSCLVLPGLVSGLADFSPMAASDAATFEANNETQRSSAGRSALRSVTTSREKPGFRLAWTVRYGQLTCGESRNYYGP